MQKSSSTVIYSNGIDSEKVIKYCKILCITTAKNVFCKRKKKIVFENQNEILKSKPIRLLYLDGKNYNKYS